MKTLLSKKGFTLIELMVVVAIMGVLITIAVPQYNAFQAKSLQGEAKIALTAIYTVLQAYNVENETYTGCLKRIGYTPKGSRRYYKVGFDNSHVSATECGIVTPKVECGFYIYWIDGRPKSSSQCKNPDGNYEGEAYFGETIEANSSSTLPTGKTEKDYSKLEQNVFIASAIGSVSPSSSEKDIWSIDEKKEIMNDVSGI